MFLVTLALFLVAVSKENLFRIHMDRYISKGQMKLVEGAFPK